MHGRTEDYAYCEQLFRRDDPDRWFSSFFIPQPFRRHVHALYAFNLEIARAREVVSEPLLGEVRFQWWRDALEGIAQSDVAANPVAAALIDTVERFSLPREKLTGLIDARLFDLYDDPMPSMDALEAYAEATSSSLFQLAAQILDKGEAEANAAIASHAGIGYAITGLLRALPWHLARGQIYIPAEILAANGVERDQLFAGPASEQLTAALADMRTLARQHIRSMEAKISGHRLKVASVFLPASLCEAYLQRMERRDYDLFESAVALPQWRRQWILWRASSRWG